MKDLIQKVASFIAFDSPIDRNQLSQQFVATHLRHQKIIPQWSINATRQKAIATYWFVDVSRHFAFMFGFPVLLVLLTSSHFEPVYFPVVFIVGIYSFAVLLLFIYWPNFSGNFLPHLETIKESYERKQLEQLEKCKRAQLSNPALVLIYYVFDKVSGMNSLQCNDQSAAMLTKLYGVDQGSMKKNLELIYGKKKNLPPRKYTEIRNRFQEAYDFFEEIQFREGVNILNPLEQKFKVSD
jgi:hypothetical protein